MDKITKRNKFLTTLAPFYFAAFLIIFWLAIYKVDDRLWSFLTMVIASLAFYPCQVVISNKVQEIKKSE
ncbi:hypothetical protein HFA01_31520 [Halobacillus faecis]|uniref:Uncharacterized protein n=1 Tax=Halobacillus faecis TaxID=360184 RepID=A0A511WUP9_9BACI|nr:hypothetical protein HFA01_31520 [Halobacillus faecis]